MSLLVPRKLPIDRIYMDGNIYQYERKLKERGGQEVRHVCGFIFYPEQMSTSAAAIRQCLKAFFW
jgi:hypothetical protein